MKIKLFIAVSCPEGSYKAGDVADLTEKTARGLIAGGYALEIDKPVDIVPEAKVEPVKSKKVKSPGRSVKRWQ